MINFSANEKSFILAHLIMYWQNTEKLLKIVAILEARFLA